MDPNSDAPLPRLTDEEIITLNQAAASLDGVMAASPKERHVLAVRLFAMAGNPMSEEAEEMTRP
jgi:hypothetical protein